ncbi:pentatricopeptide repeat-containing protein At4g37170 [Impatiens glandulifera]|uniref:pentatricopeptide repeat-containing protein At4g37170 n=1 Tax=Impatiens glandulifera TaxID=253017 RepID=UPI001FB1965D|nr:pentatricopeptide repeat-containing protein At4g37170 [Impatiens glandulifera]
MRRFIHLHLHKLSRPTFSPRFHLKHTAAAASFSSVQSPLDHKPQNQTSYIGPNSNTDFINHLCKNNKYEEAISVLCEQMRLKDAIKLLHFHNRPSASTYSSLLKLCLKQRALLEAKTVHKHFGLSGFVPGVFLLNRLLSVYCECGSLVDARNLFDGITERDVCSWNLLISGYVKDGSLQEARKLFDLMPERDNFSWNAMISGYVRHDKPQEALKLYGEIQIHDHLKCSKFIVSSALAAASSIRSVKIGKEIHAHIIRTGLDSDSAVWSALCDIYGKCGSIYEARHIFDQTTDKDIVSWTAMIDRYLEDGKRKEGFAMFSDLLRTQTIKPNEFTFSGILNTCANQNLESVGKEVHGYMIRVGVDPSSYAASTLVHMYSRCGNIESARNAFELLLNPCLVSWTSLINGYSQHGQHEEALRLFGLMLESGTRPDHITFVGVLSACTHGGLVEKGLDYFYSIEKHGLTQTVDHYACVVDLLSRNGRFEEVENMIKRMPMKPDKFLWASLLSGCRTHGNLQLAKRAAEELLELEPENGATYVTLSNLYASAGKWSEVENLRKVMDERRVKKKPGLSWIEIKRKVHVFQMGDLSHQRRDEIHGYIEKISRKMREEGYSPRTDYVLQDVEEEQKEENLFYHSEKLAIAFGIISTPEGTPLKVFKNLRTCVDCHKAIKLISKIAERKIIMRDSKRFHCFTNGSCSCNDYW